MRLEPPEPGTVLVADDDPTNRELLRDLLETRGHTVLEAKDGAESLEVARQSLPDALLLDVMMPAPNGFEVCRRLKSEQTTAVIPILLVTALSDRNSRLEGIKAGADDFLSKPIDTHETALRVRNAIRMKRLYDLAEQRYTRLQDLEAAREQLTHMLVHDFKNPLNTIAGSLRSLSSELLPERERGHLGRALRGSERLGRMITSMLDLKRLESQSLELKLGEVEVVQFLGSALDSMTSLVDPEVSLELEAPDGLLWKLDPDLIRRVVENLADNAMRYLPLTAARLVVRAQPKGPLLRVEVEDNGGGLPLDQPPEALFEKYYSSEPNRSSQGLGLAFCKMAVELHGGRIGAQKAATGGAVFWFEIP